MGEGDSEGAVRQNVAMESLVIRKRMVFGVEHHADAEPVLRQWALIALRALRLAGLIVILLAFIESGRMVMAHEPKLHGSSRPEFSWPQIGLAMLPYVVMIPLLVVAWLNARRRARQKWLERVQAAELREVEYSAEGMALISDRARLFYRWKLFTRVVNRRRVFVFFLHPSLAAVVPKVEMTAAEEEQVMEWARAKAEGAAVTTRTGGISFEIHGDYMDFREKLKLQRAKSQTVWIIVRRWVMIGMVAVALGVYFWSGSIPYMGPRDIYWYWHHFGFPVMVAAVCLWTLGFWLLQKWMTWRDQRRTFTTPGMVTMDEEGMQLTGANAAHDIRWDAFNRISVGKRVVLVGLVGGNDITIPLRQMPSGRQAEILQMLEGHIVTEARGFPVQLSG